MNEREKNYYYLFLNWIQIIKFKGFIIIPMKFLLHNSSSIYNKLLYRIPLYSRDLKKQYKSLKRFSFFKETWKNNKLRIVSR